MELRAYLAVLGKRWMIIVGVFVTCAAAAVASIVLTTPTYRATAQLFVSTEISAGNVNQQLYQGGIFSGDRVKSYTQLATSPAVLSPVVAALGLSTTPQLLAEDVQATAPADTVLIDVTADSTSPQMAATLANSVGNSLSRVIERVETSASGAASPVKVTLITPALVPDAPHWPPIPLVLAMGLLIGLVAGIALALLVEKLDTSIRLTDDLLGVADLPILAEVGHDRRRRLGQAIVRDDPHGVRSEAYRQLRTSLQFAAVGDARKVIVVTSALPQEGKSSVAGNLALSLAQLGGRVCLVDGDLRRPSLAEYFGLVGEAGVSTVIVGRASINDVLQTVDHGLTVITSGVVPPNPTELLSSPAGARMLKELSDRFDTVVVDAPPVLPAADAAVLAAAADGVVFVIRAGRTRRQDVKRALGALDQVHARMLGAVLNMVAPTRQSRRGYGYSSYYTSSSEGDVVAPEEFPVVTASDATPPTPPRPRPSPRPRPRPEPPLDRGEEEAVPVRLLRVGSAGEGRPDARNDC